ncbi:hypothetical protein TR2A62_3582 [Thalassobium sp. R2A62]|nr:hypothetical protein TR2A62_3582 [Thalassobium sp. R2A62]
MTSILCSRKQRSFRLFTLAPNSLQSSQRTALAHFSEFEQVDKTAVSSATRSSVLEYSLRFK